MAKYIRLSKSEKGHEILMSSLQHRAPCSCDEAINAQNSGHDYWDDRLPGQQLATIVKNCHPRRLKTTCWPSRMIMSGRITPIDAIPTPDFAVP